MRIGSIFLDLIARRKVSSASFELNMPLTKSTHQLPVSLGVAAILIHLFSGHAAAQTTGRGAEPLLEIVEVVGCLTAGPTGTWVLANATAPVIERAPFSNPEAVKTAGAKRLGTQRFRLLNVGVFNPDAHKGHKMVARGLWLKDPKDPRINLTSLLMLDAACPR